MQWVKMETEEAAAVDFTRCHDYFSLEIAESDTKALLPETMQKASPLCIIFNYIYLFDKYAITEQCPYSEAAIFCLEWSFNY